MTAYSRLALDDYFSQLATLVGERSTCRRRKVGCVLVDSRGHIAATGYNGVPKQFPHCLDHPCIGAAAPSGSQLSDCMAVHAEMNAFLQLTSTSELTAYLTVTPCFECAKVICNSNVTRIVASGSYKHSPVTDRLFEKANIELLVRNRNNVSQ